MKHVLVTGGAGYIGSHTAWRLKQAGYSVVVLDNLSQGTQSFVTDVLQVPLIKASVSDTDTVKEIIQFYKIDSVMHFAGFIQVGESVHKPVRYYRNNVADTIHLIETVSSCGVDKFVFSSTAAVYGQPLTDLIEETHILSPINPYGWSKLMIEQVLRDLSATGQMRHMIFRYFNAAGADPSGLLGENHNPETHLIPLILEAALGLRPHISVFGDDYMTPDGTCIRDYVHVNDLADAHVLGLCALYDGSDSELYNLGNGCGFSVKEVIDTAVKVTGRNIPIIHSARREGDPARLVSSSQKIRSQLKWTPQYPDLGTITEHAWKFLQRKEN